MRKLLTILTVTTVLLVVSICNLANDSQTYGPTTANDHLWFIAQKTRPNRDISKQQMMIAILQANPNAFTDQNVNGLLEGQYLTIPSLEAINAISPTTALIQISAQNRAWINKMDYDQPTHSRGSKAPPFGTIKHTRNSESVQVHQTFSNPTASAVTQTQTSAMPEENSIKAKQPIDKKEITLPASVETLNEIIPSMRQNLRLEPILTAALPTDHTNFIESLYNLNLPVAQALSVALQANHPTNLSGNPSLLATTSITPNLMIADGPVDTLIKNDIASHVGSLKHQLDDFLIRLNELDSYTHERLNVLEDEHVAMKNKITSLNKEIKQLKENYLQESTPIFQRSAFGEYGFWIMGSSILACLFVLIYTISRKRRAKEGVNKKVSATIKRKMVSPEEEVELVEVIEDEYDYLGSQEGISAKLDLARAYIAMGNSTQASVVLNEVITQGNEEQRFTARKILSEILQETVH